MQVKLGYKRTEVGAIPEDWSVLPLRRISPKQGVGLVINPSTYFDKAGTVPLLVGSNVEENVIDASTANRISALSNQILSASRLAKDDLVTVRVGYPGLTAVVPPELDGCNCASMMITRRHASFDSRWLCAAMNSQLGRRQFAHVQYGTAQKQFNIGDAINFRFATPPLAEQRAIAAALGDIDALLTGLDRLIAKKRDLKQAAMQQLLTGQTRLPGFLEDWEVKRLGEIAALYQPVTISSKQFTDAGFPVYGANGVVGFFDEFNHETAQVTITCRGSTCGTVNRTVEKSWITGNAMVVNCDQSKYVTKEFMYYLLLSQNLSVCITGTGQPQIVRGPLADFELGIPRETTEQSAIAGVLTDIDDELTALKARREKTRALKQGMMQELLTGRTRLV